MAKKYKISLRIIGILLTLSLLILISYIKYQKTVANGSLVIVENGLSINFLNGNTIDSNNYKNYTFSVTNNKESELVYYIFLENITGSNEDWKYDLKERNNKVSILQGEVTKEDPSLASMIKISSGETHFYTLTIASDIFDLKAKLKIDLEEGREEYFASTIIKNNQVKKETQTSIGEELALGEEGLIESKDDFGTIYYFRGNSSNNYVSFANYIWRIVKINSDGSVRLILDDYIDSTSNFYLSQGNQTIKEKLDFSQNKMQEALNEWYQKNLIEYEKNLISSKYCVDDSIFNTDNTKNYYLGNNRLLRDLSATYNCLGTNYTSRIGLLSADEVVLAGGTTQFDNEEYYLYLPNKMVSWWTMTPSHSDEENITFFEVTTKGKVAAESIGTYYRGVRPVINLVKRTIVSGTGTSSDPYTLN